MAPPWTLPLIAPPEWLSSGSRKDGSEPPSEGGESRSEGGFLNWLHEKAHLGVEGGILSFDHHETAGQSKSPFAPELAVKYGVEGSVYGNAEDPTGWAALGGGGGVKVGVDEHGPIAALYAEAYAFQAKAETVFAGDKNLGATGGASARVLAGEAVAGFKDGSLQATIGGTLASVKGEMGANVAGFNVGVSGEIGLKAELGFKIGEKTEIKLPFVSLGLSFGGAKG